MHALKRPLRAIRLLYRRLLDTSWFMRRLGYPLGDAWSRAGEWTR